MIDSNQLRPARQRRTGKPALPNRLLKNQSRDVILIPFALRSRTALSEAKGLRVNSAKDLLC